MRIDPHRYQIRGVRLLLECCRVALFLDMGLGKTVIMLTAIYNLLQRGTIRGALIFAPLRVCYNVWPLELQKWDHLQHLSCGILHGPKKGKVLKEKHDIYVINYEGINWLHDQLSKYKRDKYPFDMLVYDESTAIKSPDTKRFRLMRELVGAFPRRTILTGTPAPNTLEDIWAQYYLLDDGERLGSSRYAFRERYFFTKDYWKRKWIPYPSTAEELGKKVQDITLRLTAEEYLEMPKLINNNVIWSMTEKVKSRYKEFERNFFLEMQDVEVTAVNAAALSSKLRQFLSGFVYSEESPLIAHEEKLNVLEEVIESNPGEPALVAIQFRHEYQMIKDRYPEAPVIYGGMSPKITNKLIADWNAGKIPLLIVHPASIAHGVNLQDGGRILIWYSMPWSFEQYVQLLGRIYRQGQAKPVINNCLIAKGTVDERVATTLQEKKETGVSFTKLLLNEMKGELDGVHS